MTTPLPIERGISDNHGHAEWASEDYIAKRFAGPGCVIGACSDQENARLIIDPVNVGPGHSITIAAPGSDKTSTTMTRLWFWDGSRVVFDPNNEIGPIMAPALRAMGYNVRTIDLNGGINVLDWIDPTDPKCDAHLQSAVDWTYDENALAGQAPQGKDKFFSNWGKALWKCLMADMVYSEHDNPRTLETVRRAIRTPGGKIRDMLRGINRDSPSEMARDISGNLMDMEAPETFSGITSNAFISTEWLSVKPYRDAVSGNRFLTKEILQPNSVVFVAIPQLDLIARPEVGRAIMGALLNAIFRADGNVEAPILIDVDEAWVYGPMKEIMMTYRTARKYRAVMNTKWPAPADVDAVWGHDLANSLRAASSWISYNAILDGEAADRLSKDIGTHAVLAYSEGDNRGTSRQSPVAWGSRSRGTNINVHEQSRELIKREEILRLPSNRMIVMARDCEYPLLRYTAPYYRYPKIAGLMEQSRFVRK